MVPPVAMALSNFNINNAGNHGTMAQPIPEASCKRTEPIKGNFLPYLRKKDCNHGVIIDLII